MQKQPVIEPALQVDQAAVRRGPSMGRWLVAWDIRNLSEGPLQILAGRLPHSKFKGDEKEITPIPKLSYKESAQIEFTVSCSEPPDTVVENAFLILRVLWLEKPWWVFARMRVTIDENGAPHTVAELVTTRPIGFSGI